MPKDEVIPEAEQEQENSESEETEAKGNDKAEDTKDEQEDYRGKLNATNRFLQNEGYEFKGNKWTKPESKPAKQESPKKGDDVLPTKDLYALVGAKVHEDDVDWVIKQARVAEKSVNAILKDEEVQAILKIREEKRKTADATNTKPARPGSKKSDGAQLARELSEGKVPEPGSDEAEELFWQRRGGKTK